MGSGGGLGPMGLLRGGGLLGIEYEYEGRGEELPQGRRGVGGVLVLVLLLGAMRLLRGG